MNVMKHPMWMLYGVRWFPSYPMMFHVPAPQRIADRKKTTIESESFRKQTSHPSNPLDIYKTTNARIPADGTSAATATSRMARDFIFNIFQRVKLLMVMVKVMTAAVMEHT
jgi:hypothetical protein